MKTLLALSLSLLFSLYGQASNAQVVGQPPQHYAPPLPLFYNLPKPSQQPAPPQTTAHIAIIIDDLGYNLRQGVATARLPGHLTMAILPHSPNGVALAELGYQQGKEIILHNPMSNIQKLPLDPGGLTEDMEHPQFVDTLYDNLESIPHISGLNNHMGSQLTQLQIPMQWLMTELARESLFFIDSRTSANSIAWEVAQEFEVPSRKRDVFLDNERTQAAIARQFEKVIKIAQRRGNAIAIGHPYPETVEYLQRVIPTLAPLGITLVPVSQLLPPTKAQLSQQSVPHSLNRAGI